MNNGTREAKRIAAQLLGARPDELAVLAPIEVRLLALARSFFFDVLVQARFSGGESAPLPLTAERVAMAARLALAAAVEVDDDLRRLRAELAKHVPVI